MGHGSSKSDSSEDSPGGSNSSSSSRISRLKDKLHVHSHHHRRHRRKNGSSSHSKLKDAEDFAGIALIRLIGAEMKFKDKWLACFSVGEQTFRTDISDQTSKPVWNSLSFGHFSVEDVLHFKSRCWALFTLLVTFTYPKNKYFFCRRRNFFWREMDHVLQEFLYLRPIGFAKTISLDFVKLIYLSSLLGLQDSELDVEVFDLLDPSSAVVVGNISLSYSIEDPIETEKSFARRILSLVDYNQDGHLSFSEFSDLINAFGNQVAASKKEELFKAADTNGDGAVSMDELATLLAVQQEKEPLMNCCPVCGEILEVSDKLNSMIHLTLCFDEGTGNQVMTGGFLTDTQASYGWMFKLTEWSHFSSYDIGLKAGSGAAHIVVFDRTKKRLVEEIIDPKIVLSMRAIYQSKIGLGLMDKGAREILQSISERQGRKMDSLESAKDIPKFIELFKDQINLAEVKYPLEHFKTFNEFFIRELKPGSRPIAVPERDDVAVSAADCRLTAFKTAEDCQRFWIKGRKFSVQGLLGKDVCSSAFIGGTMVIFRLAPQDYHRFHIPVSGTIEKFVDMPGCLYTVNPIAVNSKYCNVFTENKRVVSVISTEHFGKVAFVAIGATMVGSITFTKKQDDYVKKGDELGYFSFGGSTVICVFEKGTIKIDDDLLANSARSLETLVTVGMKLGVSNKKQPEIRLPNMDQCVLES